MFHNYFLSIFVLNIISELNCQIPCPLPAEIIFLGAENAAVPATYFHLYTRDNRGFPHNLTDKASFDNSNFDPNLKTVIILDGYNGGPNKEHIAQLKTFFLDYEDCNVIVVDWSIGASVLIFPDAVRNTLIVGKYIAEQIEKWKTYTSLDLNKVHVIGFSLGGQTIAFIGKYMKTGKIRRITGIDIAGACFVGFPTRYKLHYSDAKFVDVISTSTFTQGIMDQPTGHVHFKPDGGQVGRGCGDELTKLNLGALSACSHLRAVYLFASSLKNNKILPVAYKCTDINTFYRGECFQCGQDGKGCAAMGIHAEKYADKTINGTVTMYLATTFTDEYFLYQYHVEVALASNSNSRVEEGKLALNINSGTVNATLNELVYSQQITETFQPGNTYKYLIVTTHNIDRITQLEFYWYSTAPRIDSRLYIQCVKIVPMNNLERDRSYMITYGSTDGQPIPPSSTVALNIGKNC